MTATATVMETLNVPDAMLLSVLTFDEHDPDGTPLSASIFHAKHVQVFRQGRRTVARYAPVVSSNDAYSAKFWESAAKWARIQNGHQQNVGGLIGVCTNPQSPFIMREYYQNGTLVEFLERVGVEGGDSAHGDDGQRGGGRVGDIEAHVIQVWRLFRESSEELAVLHSLGIVHGNLKPNNVLVDDEGHAKLVDICGPLGGEWRWGDGDESHVDMRLMAPELIEKDGETPVPPECTMESDVYALGKCFREIVERLCVGSVLHEGLLYSMCDNDATNRPTAQQVAIKLASPGAAQTTAETIPAAVRREGEQSDTSSSQCDAEFTYDNLEFLVNKRITDLHEQLNSDIGEVTSPERLLWYVSVVHRWYDVLVRARQKQLEQQCKRQLCSVVCALAFRRWVERYWDLHTEIDAIVAMSSAHFNLSSEMHRSWQISCKNTRARQVQDLMTAVREFAQTYCPKRDKEEPESEDGKESQEDEDTHPPTELLYEALVTCHYELERACVRYTVEELDTMASALAELGKHEALRDTARLYPWFVPSYEVLHTNMDKVMGTGAFAVVKRTTWNNTSVAVKVQFDGKNEAPTNEPKDSYLSESTWRPDESADKATPATTIDLAKKTEKLIDEASLWFRLRSPRLIQLYGACHVTSRLFVCELADLGSLDKYLAERRRRGPVEHAELWRLLYQAALGLQYLHKRGIAHGDLKCNNILVGRDGKAKLGDFGLGFETQSRDVSFGLPLQAVGAYRWKAPERLVKQGTDEAERLKTDPSEWVQSDVYSLGMCFLEAATGQVPFSGLDDLVVKVLVVRGVRPLQPPKVFTPQEWQLIMDMTSYLPRNRPHIDVVLQRIKTMVSSVCSSESARSDNCIRTYRTCSC